MSIDIDGVPIRIPDIVLPHKSINLYTWSIIACDQFTSNPSYWESVREIVHDAPSTLHITLPEIYLENKEETQKYLTSIQHHMKQYRKDGIFDLHKNCLLRIQRTTKSNTIRSGLMVQVDLAQYDPHTHSDAPIRATEAIVPERLTKRIEVRKNTSLDFSHVIMLYDDGDKALIPELLSRHICSTMYETTLMLDGGHIRADVCDAQKSASILRRYFEHMKMRIAEQGNSALFVVGDGNHSLMAAKQAWIDAGADMQHPDRWALVELVNMHDEGLSVFPIHRILCNASSEKFFKILQTRGTLENKRHCLTNSEVLVMHKQSEYIWVPHDTNKLSIEILESILEEYKDLYKTVDFIHDEAEVRSHACTSLDTIGFIFPCFQKDEIFRYVHKNRIFPRKSFALGNSIEKRYYIEACDRSVSCDDNSL